MAEVDSNERRSRLVLALLALVAAGLAAVFMTIAVRGGWAFVLPFRATKLAGMLLVGAAVATATVLFQTVANNRILTPSIMGLDALFVLLQTGTVFALGARGLGLAEPRLLFLAETAILVAFATVLYRFLLRDRGGSLHLLLLVGVVCGVLFRSASLLMQRVIDPEAFAVVQARLFASFNAVQADLLVVAAAAIGVAGLAVWRLLPRLDVLLLGREAAIGLGLDHRRAQTTVLALVSVLVASATALVGPITFLGLLAANLAYRLMPTYRHALVIPAAILIAVIALVGGQLVLERVFGLDAALGMVIEFVGGIVLLALLLTRTLR